MLQTIREQNEHMTNVWSPGPGIAGRLGHSTIMKTQGSNGLSYGPRGSDANTMVSWFLRHK